MEPLRGTRTDAGNSNNRKEASSMHDVSEPMFTLGDMGGKATASGPIVVSADGKRRTVTVRGRGATGKKFHSNAVYGKQ
jgi:hypothetical protein